MTKRTRQRARNLEGRLDLAADAIKNKKIRFTRVAARLYEVPYTTLVDRVNGRPSRASIRANGLRLSYTEEEAIKNWIISLSKRGANPRLSHIQAIADYLLSKRGSQPPCPNIGKN